jgi:hypothetical protein
MAFREKYLKYKEKYLNLKNQMGGLKTLNELQNPENRQLVNTISESTVTIINAHGGIDIKEWYVIPENTYILTTSEIGGITCNIYNEVFNNLINERLNRQNLKSMLSKTIEGKTNETKPLNKKNTFKGLYELYEPHDIIPKIHLSFHHNESEYSSKDVIYTWLTYSPYQQNNSMSNSLFDSYFQVTPSRPLDIHIKKGALINIGKFKEYLYKIINDYEPNLLNDFIESNNISDEFKNYFNKSSDEYNGRKGIFSLPALYTVKDIEDQKFISMVITLYIKKYPKLDYHIKEVVDTLDRSRVNLIVLTSCLYTKEIYYQLLQKFYSTRSRSSIISHTPQYYNTYITNIDYWMIPKFTEVLYSEIYETSKGAIRELLAVTPEEASSKLDKIKYLLENRVIDFNESTLLNHILALNNIEILKIFRLNLNINEEALLSVLPGITSEQTFIEMLKFTKLNNRSNHKISEKVQYKLNFLEILINKGYRIGYCTGNEELRELYIKKYGIKNMVNDRFGSSGLADYIIKYQIKDEVIQILTNPRLSMVTSQSTLGERSLFSRLLNRGYFNDNIKLGRDIFFDLECPEYSDPKYMSAFMPNFEFYLRNLQFKDIDEMFIELLKFRKSRGRENRYIYLDRAEQFIELDTEDLKYKINLLNKVDDFRNFRYKKEGTASYLILDILKNFNNYRVDRLQQITIQKINRNIQLLEELGFPSEGIKIDKETMKILFDSNYEFNEL